MNRKTRKRIILIGLAVLVLILVVYGFLPEAVPVQTAVVQRGPLQVTVEEEGETRLENRYVLSSPVAAFARRIPVEAGDAVQAGQPLVQLEPPRPAILDARTRSEAAARVEAAQAALVQARAAAEGAETERARLERLVATGSATRQSLEQATTEAARAQAAVESARAELLAARTTLQGGASGSAGMAVQEVLRSPVAGRVLAVHRESEGQVNPGEPLVEVGDVTTLEVWVDVLSQDAVRIRPGTRVILDQWGEESQLEASVTRVSPQGFTAVSALGVEESRVTVVAELVSPPSDWLSLGTGYRVLARFVIWEGENVLQVPTGALFRTGDGWGVFVVENDRAVERTLTIGRQTGLRAQVVSGLAEGDEVIVHPENAIEDGVRVKTS